MAQAIKDNNRVSSLLLAPTVGSTPLAWTGVSLGSVVAAHAAIVDGSGNQITSFGGGTQYTNGSTQATPTGTVALGFDGTNVRALSTDTSGILKIGGVVASGSAPSGNPVLIAGSDGVNVRTLSTNTSGILNVGDANFAQGITGGDAASNGTTSVMMYDRMNAFNGTTWDRVRSGSGDTQASTGLLNDAPMVWNGSSYDRLYGDKTNGVFVNVKSFPSNQSINLAQFGGSSVTIGQQLASASIPVILPSATITTLTPPAAITGFALESGGNLDDIDAALDNIVAQETTTSGLKGLTVFGAVTTNAPTYTTLKSDALSLDTSGLLRVSIKDTPSNTNNFNVNLAASAATVTVTATNLQTNLNQIAGSSISTAASGTQLVGIADGSGNALTSNSTTYTAKKALDGNLLGTLGTAFSTAGKVDVKGADGDVFVRQATASNLKATVNILGNAAATLDAAVGAGTAPTNMVAVGGLYNSTEIGPTNGQSAALQLDSKGRLRTVIMDAAANSRGQNVNANNAAGVYIDQTTIGTTNGVTPVPSSAGGTGWQFKQFGDGTVGTDWNGTKQQIVGSAATFGGYVMIFNPNTATSFIQVFNKTSANVTLGTTVPDMVIPIPGVASASATGAAANNELVHGVKFSTGLTVAVTTTAGGSTAPSSKCYGCILYN